MHKEEITLWQKLVASKIFREVLGVIFFMIAIFTFLSLISYHPQDASFGKYISQRTPIQNYGGIIGSYLAGAFIILFGSGSFLIPILIVFISVSMFKDKRMKDYLMIAIGGLFFATFFSAFTYLILPGHDPIFGEKTRTGGAFGYLISQTLLTLFNQAGAFLIITTILLASLLLVTHISLVSSFQGGREILISYLKKISEYVRSRKNPEAPVEPAPDPAPEKEDLVNEPLIFPGSPVIIKEKKAKSALKIVPPATKEPEINIDDFAHLPISSEYQLPPLSFLDDPPPENKKKKESTHDLEIKAAILEKKLLDFNIKGKVTQVLPGPVITTYEFEPDSGIKVSRIQSLADDLAMAMRAINVRILAPIPGKAVVGIEIPNLNKESVYLKEVLSADKLKEGKIKLPIALGKSIMGEPLIVDLAQIPHLLIAGATGSGKSVGINGMICSLLFNLTPDEVNLIMIDPKMLELSIYDGIPHLITPVVTNPKKAAVVLKWLVEEMERRYKLLSEKGVRNIIGYNTIVTEMEKEKGKKKKKEEEPIGGEETGIKPEEKKLPYIVIVIDELADLMMVSSKDVEDALTRLAQMARASGIHLMVATQRPSVDVLTGIIKANFPARISFQVSSRVDSRTILDNIGAERLLGHGDMLFLPPGTSKIQRIHGSWVSEIEIKKLVAFLKKQAKPQYEEKILIPKFDENSDNAESKEDDFDEKYDEALAIVAQTRQASISMIQRRLRIGYNRAARIIEVMEKEGVIGPADGVKPRDVYVKDINNPDRLE